MKSIDIGRVFICFLLICCLLINISPFRAHAMSTAVTVTVIGVGVAVATAIAFQALGVRQGSDPSAFQTLVSECSSALSADWAVNGLVNMLAVNDGIITKTYANQNFMQSVLDWVFDRGSLAVSEEYVFPYSDSDVVMEKYREIMAYPYTCVAFNQTSYYWYFYGSDYPITIEPGTNDGYWIRALDGRVQGYRIRTSVNVEDMSLGMGKGAGSFINITNKGLISEITTSSDLTLESVGTDIASDYSDYTSYSFTNDDGEEYLPVTIPSLSVDSFVDQAQTDAQAGTTSTDIIETLTQAGSVPGTDSTGITLQDILDGLLSIPQAIGQAIADVLAKAFVPSDAFVASKVEALTLKYPYLDTFLALGDDLKGFFSGLGTKPPVIYIDLGAADVDYNIGGRVIFTDLSWYAAYKSTMDAVLGGFIWLWFAWRLYLSLPGIINGVSGATGAVLRFGESRSKDADGGDF